MLTLEKAREWLRIDGMDNDEIIMSLVAAASDYIEITTGMSAAQQEEEPLAETAEKFLIQLWYNAEQSESEKLQRTIGGLLKALTVKARG